MLIFYLTFFVVTIASILALIFTKFYQKEDKKLEKSVKILVVVWMAIRFIGLFLPDEFAMRTFDDTSKYLSGENIWFAVIRWLNDVTFIVLPISVFFKNKTFIKSTVAFAFIISVLNASVYFKYIKGYTSTEGAGIMALRFFSPEVKGFFINTAFRSVYFGLENYIQIILLAFVFLSWRKEIFDFKYKKEVLLSVGILVSIIFSIIPIYVPQYLTKGYSFSYEETFTTFKMGEFFHIVWIIAVILEGIILTKIFKNKSREAKLILVYVLSFSLLMQYNQMFTGIGEITAHRMPFQLCNMAPLFILLMLLLKSEKMYHFTLVINSVGAIIAMILCDTSPFGVSYIMNMHYILEHTNVILIPILCATLRVFSPLKNSDVKHFIIGFTAYFLFVLLVGGTFTGIKELTANDYFNCNYLFMFNKEESASIIGFVAPLFDVKVKLFNFFTLSLVQLLVYIVFTAICTGAFFLMKLLLNKKAKRVDIQNETL